MFREERVVGYFPAGGLRTGSAVYVTSQRIIVNRRKTLYAWKTHVIIGVLAGVAPTLPGYLAVPIFVGISITIGALLVRRKFSRRRWPTLGDVESGQRRFEVKRGSILSIEMKRPGRLRSGYVTIVPLTYETVRLKVVGRKSFAVARNLLTAFEPNRVKSVE